MSKSPITCHVLDSTHGKPASGVQVSLHAAESNTVLAQGSTNSDGRCTTLLAAETKLKPGVYKMVFETGMYFAQAGRPSFYPRVEIFFQLPETPDPHYHIPLLLSPYSYTTYRGS